LDRESGGGPISGIVAAAICLATLLGAGRILAYVPKVALGGLLLYLGFMMLKQWLWDQRARTALAEFLQILLILALVANYGFMVGFSAGIVIACLVFVVSYARVPLASLATTLAVFASTVVRPEGEAEILREHGEKSLLYRLSGYVFFGSANRIEAVFQATHEAIEGVVIDFTGVSGIDSSAIGVFQRILRRYRDTPTRFFFSHSPQNQAKVRAVGEGIATDQIAFHPSLDRAVEAAEDAIIARHGAGGERATGLAFLHNADRDVFISHCELKWMAAGGFLCAEGELSDEVFFIEYGELEVTKKGDRGSLLRLAKLLSGAMVGELAFYTGSARTASIVAVTESAVYVLRREALEQMRSAHPDVAARFDQMVIRKISRDLARTSKLVTMFN